MFVVDCFRGHTNEDSKEVLQANASDHLAIPSSVLQQIQPLYVASSKLFKEHLVNKNCSKRTNG